MKLNKKIITLSLAASMLLTGCSVTQLQQNINNNLGKIGGVAIGAAGGAAIGNKIAGREGAIVGALVGGIFGLFIGENIDQRRENIEKIAKIEDIEVHFEDIKDKDGEKIGQSFITEDKYQFNTGSAKLNKKAKKYFQAFARQYSRTDQKVLIIGHTDDRGSDAYNYELSEKRAEAVAQIFKDAGIDGKNIYIYALGESKPIESNLTKEGQGKNRRVEIVEAPSEEDIARYAYMKPTNSKLLNKEKVGNYKKDSKKKGKELARSKELKNSKQLAMNALPKEYMDNLRKLNKKENIPSAINNPNKAKSNIENSKNIKQASNIKRENGSLPSTMINSDGVKLNTYGVENIAKQNSGECTNDFLYAPTQKELAVIFKDGEKFNPTNNDKEIIKIVGMPIEKSSFSIIPMAHANVSNTAFAKSCLQDEFKRKGTVKNFESGKSILIDKTVKQIPWIDGTMWYATSEDKFITLSPISVAVENVEPITCPSVSIMKTGNNYPIFGASTKVVTRQGDKGFIYRVYPTIENNDSKFECMDIAFSDQRSDTAKGNIYYIKNGTYYKKSVEFKRFAEIKKESKGLFSW